nr:hypothetical protein [uncultured Flavobacterium sp.]
MKAPNYTPAPWVSKPVTSSVLMKVFSIEAEGIQIGWTPNQSEEAKANAQLIAAAPDLAEALSLILDRLETETHSLAIKGTINKAKEALIKAGYTL